MKNPGESYSREQYDAVERERREADAGGERYGWSPWPHETARYNALANKFTERYQAASKRLQELEGIAQDEAEKLNEEYNRLLKKAEAQSGDIQKTLDEIKKFETEKLKIKFEVEEGNPNRDPSFKERRIGKTDLIAPEGKFRVVEDAEMTWRSGESAELMGDFSSLEEAHVFASDKIIGHHGYHVNIFNDKGENVGFINSMGL